MDKWLALGRILRPRLEIPDSAWDTGAYRLAETTFLCRLAGCVVSRCSSLNPYDSRMMPVISHGDVNLCVVLNVAIGTIAR